MSRQPLNETAFVKLSALGAGSAKLGPLTAREVWYPDEASVKTIQVAGTIVNEAQCVVSTGDVNTKRFRDSCLDGSTGDATGRVSGKLMCGSYVWADWTGGDANVTAQLTVTGEKEI